MTKRLKLLYQDEPPTDAPDVVWMPDAADIAQISERIPGAVGYIDLDHGHVEVQPGTLDPAAVASRVAEIRQQVGTRRPSC